MVTTLFGHEISYWEELERRFNAKAGPDAEALLEEVLLLRGKVSFYESRIAEMAKVGRG